MRCTNAISLHAFQLLPQHLLRNAGNCALKIGKTHNLAIEEIEENDELPSAFEQAQRCFNMGSGRGRRIALRHHILLTYFFVRTSHYRCMVKDFYQCNYLPNRLFLLVRFARWDEVLAEPARDSKMMMTAALRHYA